jgi:AcrR family transcriptional regulator
MDVAEQPSDSPSTRRLDTTIILDAALALAREPGTKSVTVRQLGTRLGADPTAIYRHFRSKDDLMRALLDSILGIALARGTVAPDDWQLYLRESASNTLAVFLEYPVIGAEAMRLNSSATNELLSVEGILSAFAAAGLDGEQSVRHYGVYSGFVLSFCSGLARSRSAAPGEDADESPWIDQLATTTASHPHIVDHRDELLALRVGDVFRSAIELIIDDAARATA